MCGLLVVAPQLLVQMNAVLHDQLHGCASEWSCHAGPSTFCSHAPCPPPPVQITLEPCTMLQPHIHPHAEFAFTVSGEPG